MADILTVQGLTKDYGEERGAINIEFSIGPGEIVGFLGPNGAGKTTTMQMITQQIEADEGSVQIFGQTVRNDDDYLKVAEKVGFMPSSGGLYEHLTVKKLFQLAAELYGIDPDDAKEDIEHYAKEFKLDLNRQVKKLSFGNKRKVSLIQAIMHKPQLLILDEPTSGLDPLIQKQTLRLIRSVKEYGGSVLLSSHVLAEVQAICDRVVIIKDAHIVFTGTTDEVLKRAYRKLRVIKPSKDLQDKLEEIDGVDQINTSNAELTAYVTDPKEVIDCLVKAKHYEFYIERATLEEAFMAFY